jgi:hypothetical protein
MAKKLDTVDGAKVTKAAAYRDAEAKLGRKAPLDEVQKHILDSFGIEMSRLQVSQYRSNEKKRKPKRGRPKKSEVAGAQSKAPVSKSGSISDFITTMRSWENKIGAAEICRAIDALYKNK